MLFDLVLRGAQVVFTDRVESTEVGVRDGRIAYIGDVAPGSGEVELDLRGLHLFPGLIDTQVHFREPGMEAKEDLETGSRASIAGGVTAFFEMPNTVPTTATRDALDDKLRRADGRCWADYAFFVGATTDNAEALGDLETRPGTPGVKIFMGSSTGTLLVPDDETLERVLRHGRKRCPIHAEDHFRLQERKGLISKDPHPREHPFLRDSEAALRATRRILSLSERTGRPVHILHVSTANELPVIAEAKRAGHPVTAEVTPQHLWFAAPDCYEALGTFAQMNPPLRDATHREALRQALRDGLFDVIGSDHAPHTREEKAKPYPESPSGMPGVQTTLSVLLTLRSEHQLLDLSDIVRLLAEGPRRIYGIASKGAIQVGNDADLVAVDLGRVASIGDGNAFTRIESRCGWSPYEGICLRGWPMITFLRGRAVWREGSFLGSAAGRPVAFH